jgi:hypothetical protein
MVAIYQRIPFSALSPGYSFGIVRGEKKYSHPFDRTGWSGWEVEDNSGGRNGKAMLIFL